MAKLVSKTYGDALFEAALEQNAMDAYFEEVQVIRQLLEENGDVGKLMNHPKIDKDQKVQIIEEIFSGRVRGEITGLLRLLVEKGHFSEVDSVLQYFIDQVKEYKKIGTALVTSAVELSDAQKKAVKEKLLATTDYVEFEINYEVDPELIGGMRIRIGDRVVDSTIQSKLKELTKSLMNVQIGISS